MDQGSRLQFMVLFTAVWGSMYEPFAHKCRLRQEQVLHQVSSPSKLKAFNWAEREALLKRLTPKGIRLLLGLHKHARRHNLFCLSFYVYVVGRYLLTRLASLSWFADYHLLDCFILGRIRSVGRMYLIGPLAASVLQTLFFYYRFELSRCASSNRLQFQVFEFLLHDYDEVLANEIAHLAQPHWRHSFESDADSHCKHQQQEQSGGSGGLRARTSSFPQPRMDPASSGSRRGEQFLAWSCSGQLRGHSSSRLQLASRNEWAPPSLLAQHRDPLFYARNTLRECDLLVDKSFRSSSVDGPEWILRPNRTSASWQLMAKISSLCFWMTLATGLSALAFCAFIMVPPTATRMSFEIYYPACARWLQRHQQAELARLNQSNWVLAGDRLLNAQDGSELKLSYASIHLAVGRRLHCDRPISETPILQLLSDDPLILPWTSYRLCRFLFDVAQSYVFYFDFGIVFCAHFYILLMMSTDVVLNALDIKRRLLKLLEELLQTRHHERMENKQVYAHLEVPEELFCSGSNSNSSDQSRHHENLNKRPSPWQVHKRRQHELLNEHIMSLQSLLIDHFNLVKGYNQFVSHYLFLLLVTLFAFSGAFTVLIFTLKDQAIELEFLICELLAIVFIIPLFAGPCLVHIYNLQLNALIARAMALDSTSSLTKFRWIILMSHYQPMPLYCFTLFERTPVSWLFFLKLVSWCFSAVFVLANFLYVYKHPD